MPRLTHRLVTAAVALGAAAAGTTFVGVAPAAAAACPSATGVTVVVEHRDLGGGTAETCVADGGGQYASSLFPDAGHPLTYAQRQPGFVCRVDGVPTSDPCVDTSPASAYWALLWTDGRSGRWTYSNYGVQSLKIPEGGSVAFVWDDQDGQATPSVPAPTHTASSPSSTSSSPSPSARPTAAGSGGSSGRGGSSGAAPRASGPASPDAAADAASTAPAGAASAGGRHPRGRGASAPPSSGTAAGDPTAAGEPTPSGTLAPDATTSAEPADPSSGGLPGWVGALAVVVLAGGAGGVALRRRSAR